MDTSEAGVKRLEAAVVEGARGLQQANSWMTWKHALEASAKTLCDGWDWEIAEFIGSSHENAHFFLTQYHGR